MRESQRAPYGRLEYLEVPSRAVRPQAGQRWLVFADQTGFGERVIAQLRSHGCDVVTVQWQWPALMKIAR